MGSAGGSYFRSHALSFRPVQEGQMLLQTTYDIADTVITLLPFVAMGAIAAYLSVHFGLVHGIK